MADGGMVTAGIAATMIFLAGAICWRSNLLGGGDVKLLSAATVVVPNAMIGDMLMMTAFAGMALAIAYLAVPAVTARPPLPTPGAGFVLRVFRAEYHRIYRKPSLPYACAISLGVLFSIRII